MRFISLFMGAALMATAWFGCSAEERRGPIAPTTKNDTARQADASDDKATSEPHVKRVFEVPQFKPKADCSLGQPGCPCKEDYSCLGIATCLWGSCYGAGFPRPPTYLYSDAARSDPLHFRKLILETMRLEPGQRVAEIGARRGDITFLLALFTGEKGRVFAIDWDDKHIRALKEKHERHRKAQSATSVDIIASKGARDAGYSAIQTGSLDWVLMSESVVFKKHNERATKDPRFVEDVRFLSALREKLLPSGRVLYHVSWQDQSLALTDAQVIKRFVEAGFDPKPKMISLTDRLPEWTYRLDAATGSTTVLLRGHVIVFERGVKRKALVAPRVHCSPSKNCSELGLCGERSGVCLALKEEHCAASEICRTQNACQLRKGRCVTPSDDACAASLGCSFEGRCSELNGLCVPKLDQECKASTVCSSNGRCWLKEHHCVARSSADCAGSKGCTEQAQCLFDRGNCVATAELCSESEFCAQEGKCTEHEGRCVAGSDEGCRASTFCDQSGRCHLGPEKTCIARTQADCAQSKQCIEYLRCVLKDGGCVTGDEPSCLATQGCLVHGQCTYKSGDCIATKKIHCEASRGCFDNGKCVLENGQCVSDLSSCRALKKCEEEGLCSPDGHGCAAKSTLDCTNSKACKKNGRCLLKDKKCVVGKKEVMAQEKWSEGSTRENQPGKKWVQREDGVWEQIEVTNDSCAVGNVGCACQAQQRCVKGGTCYWGLCFGEGFPTPKTYRYTKQAQHDYYRLKKLILSNVAVEPGQRIADIGAGRGNYTFVLATMVEETGIVYATDIDAMAVERLQLRVDQLKGSDHPVRVEPILVQGGRETGLAKLPERHLDWILMVNSVVFQSGRDELADIKYLRELHRALKVGGKVLYHVDWQELGHELTVQQLADLFHRSGFARHVREIPMPSDMPEKTYYLSAADRSKKELVRGYILVFRRDQ